MILEGGHLKPSKIGDNKVSRCSSLAVGNLQVDSASKM